MYTILYYSILYYTILTIPSILEIKQSTWVKIFPNTNNNRHFSKAKQSKIPKQYQTENRSPLPPRPQSNSQSINQPIDQSLTFSLKWQHHPHQVPVRRPNPNPSHPLLNLSIQSIDASLKITIKSLV